MGFKVLCQLPSVLIWLLWHKSWLPGAYTIPGRHCELCANTEILRSTNQQGSNLIYQWPLGSGCTFTYGEGHNKAYLSCIYYYYYYLFAMLRVEHRVPYMLGEHSTILLCPQS